MTNNIIINSFVAGEISPRLAGRSDIQQYYQSAAEIRNMLIECYGGAKKAPGTYFVKEVKDSDNDTIVRSFIFSDEQAYILEIGDLYIRFYMDNGQIESGGNPYEISTSYPSSVIRELQFTQTADILYITHPDYPQATLTRTGHTSWTLTPIDYSVDPARPALMDENITTTTITVSGAISTVTLTASAAIFNTSSPSWHINSLWRVDSAQSVSANDWASTTGYSVGNYITFDDIIYHCISAHTSGASFTVDQRSGKWSRQDIYVKITAVASGTVATGTILYGDRIEPNAASYPTTTWSEGAWSKYRGYPKALTISEQRLVYGYTKSQPQTNWPSQTGAYNVFEAGVNDSDAMIFKTDANQVEIINWLFPAEELLSGTTGGIHNIGTGSDTTPLTPTTGRIRKKGNYGTSAIPPQAIGNSVFYWQKYARKLREYVYSLDNDNYVLNDATVMSEHITESGIVDMAYQQSPDNILWCVRDDGKLCSFTKQAEQKVSAWALHDTQGFYESVAVIPKESYDEVWFVVRRVIDGDTKRYIEYMTAPTFDEQEDMFFVHSGLTLDEPKDITNIEISAPTGLITITSVSHGYSNLDEVKIRGVVGMTELNQRKFLVANAASSTFTLQSLEGDDIDGSDYADYESGGEARECTDTVTGLEHLKGKTVQVLVDGAVHPDCVVDDDGEIALSDTFGQKTVGLGYTGRLKTNDLEAAPGTITSQGRTKRVSNITVNIYESLGFSYGTEDRMDHAEFRRSSMNTDEMIPLFTGIKNVSFPSGWGKEKQVIIEQEQCLPLHVRSVVAEIETN